MLDEIFKKTQPVLIKENILNLEQLLYITSEVKAHTETWSHMGDWSEEYKGIPLHLIGWPLFRNCKTDLRPLIIKRSSWFLKKHSWLLDTFTSALTEVIGIPCLHKPNESLPGFQIFNTAKNTLSNSYSPKTYHVDYTVMRQEDNEALLTFFNSDLEYDRNVYSFLICLELPKNGGGLIWKDINEQPHYFPYKVGNLYGWPGRMPHTYADVNLDDEDSYRITFQIHGTIHKKQQIFYYWW